MWKERCQALRFPKWMDPPDQTDYANSDRTQGAPASNIRSSDDVELERNNKDIYENTGKIRYISTKVSATAPRQANEQKE